jgi:hypothetical protein
VGVKQITLLQIVGPEAVNGKSLLGVSSCNAEDFNLMDAVPVFENE